MACLMEGTCGILRLTANVLILFITVFDLAADWLVFRNFWVYHEDDEFTWKLTKALLAFCIIASLLFILEVRNSVVAILLFKKHLMADLDGWEDGEIDEDVEDKAPQKKEIDTKQEEKSLTSWQESVSFMLLAWEDLPITIILYLAFSGGSCEVFSKVFQNGPVANLSLLGTFVSATWKLCMSLFFCICKCISCEGWKGKESCCLCFRMFRPILAVLLMGFAGYLYFKFNEEGTSVRSCNN